MTEEQKATTKLLARVEGDDDEMQTLSEIAFFWLCDDEDFIFNKTMLIARLEELYNA